MKGKTKGRVLKRELPPVHAEKKVALKGIKVLNAA